MPHRTDIEWADYSSNPLRARNADGKAGWSCAKISPGCLHCYASTLNGRFGNGLPFSVQGTRDAKHYLDEKELRHILTFRPKGLFKGGTARPKVFPFDMTDVFGEWVDLDDICTLFGAFALRPDADFLILTKRPQRMAEICNTVNIRDLLYDGMERAATVGDVGDFLYDDHWPLPNIWVGTSCEDQEQANKRIPHLLRTPAAVRFLSCEPLLESIDLTKLPVPGAKGGLCFDAVKSNDARYFEADHHVDWVIAGGESGHGARPCDLNAIRSLVRQCREADTACFVKQLGSNAYDSAAWEDGNQFTSYEQWVNKAGSWLGGVSGAGYPYKKPEKVVSLDSAGRQCRQGSDFQRAEAEGTFPVKWHYLLDLADKKGGDWNEWPADLRVREFPEVARV